MAKSASAGIKMSAAVNYSNTDALGVTYTGTPTISTSFNLTSSQITKVYSSEATISSPTTIQLTNVTDSFGSALSFTKLMGLYVQNNSANQNLTVGGGTHPVLGTDSYTINAGEVLFQNSTFTVTSGSADTLTLTPAASLSYTLIAVGI